MPFDAVIVAAGASTRFGKKDKLSEDLCGRPVLAWSLSAFASVPDLGTAVLVTAPAARPAAESLARRWAPDLPVVVADGGPRRRDSVEAGLRCCSAQYVAIHDGARPLITRDVIERVVGAARGVAGAIAAVPVTDTIKEVEDTVIVGHLQRARLWASQTPQVVRRDAWLEAAALSDEDETDDAAMLARLGLQCLVVPGDPSNIKITMPVDMTIAREILQRRGLPCTA